MFNKVTIILCFEDEGVAQGLFNHAVGQLPKAKTVNSGQENEERGIVRLEECYHDQDEGIPCYVIEEHLTPS